MFKKFTAITLSLLMVLSSVGVFAAPIPKPSGMLVSTDNFDSFTVDTPFDKTVGYPSGEYTSDVFVKDSSSTTNVAYSTCDIVIDGGVNGTPALKMNGGNTRSQLTGTHEIASGEWVEYSTDIRFVFDTDTTTGTITLGAGNLGGSTRPLFQIVNENGWQIKGNTGTGSSNTYVTACACITDTWYKLVIRADATTKTGWILDQNGKILATSATKTKAAAEAGKICFAKFDGNYKGDIYLDNAEIKKYTPAEHAPMITTAPEIAGKQNVPADTASVTVVTDQPLVVNSSVAKLNDADCNIAEDTTKLYTYTISLPELEEGTEYTLDLSGLSNGTKTVGEVTGVTGTYTFKTVAAAVIPNVLESVPANGATGVSADTKTMTITFNKEMPTYPTAGLTLASTAGNITATVATEDYTTFTLNWSGDLASNATYTVDLTGFKDSEGVAPTTTSISFTSENLGIVVLEEDFENPENVFSDNKGNRGYTSDLITMANISSGNQASTPFDYVSLVSDGHSGNAVQFKTGEEDVRYLGNKLSTTTSTKPNANEAVVATWRFRLDDMADFNSDNLIGSRIYIGQTATAGSGREVDVDNIITHILTNKETGKPQIRHMSKQFVEDGSDIEEDRWYNITYVITASEHSIAFVDDVTGELVYTRSDAITLGDNVYIMPFTAHRATDTFGTSNQNQTFTIDDFSLRTINLNKATHKLALSGDISTNINGTDAEITFNFNQPVVPEADMLALFEGVVVNAGVTENNPSGSVPEITYPDFCTAKISFTGLKAFAAYTLDYSGVTAVSGADLGTNRPTALVGFETGEGAEAVSIMGNIAFSNGLVEGSKIIADIYSKEARTPKVIAAFYKNGSPAELSAIEIADVSLIAGENANKEIVLTKNIDADYVVLYVWESLDSLVPLMGAYESNCGN